MKRIGGITLCICGALALGAAGARAAAVETWTSRAGTSVRAEFVEIAEPNMVVLRTTEGEQMQIPLSALDDAGQARVEALRTAQEARRVGEAQRAVQQLRAIVPEGFRQADDSVLARFETPLFDAWVYTPSRRMDLFIKEDGKYVSPPVRVRMRVHYRDDANRREPKRALVDFIEPPSFQNNVVHFRMRMQDDVLAEVRYEFRNNGIDIGYRVQDPEGIELPSDRSYLALNFPEIYHHDTEASPPVFYMPRYPEGLSREDFIAKVSAYEFRAGAEQGGRRSFPFSQPVTGLGGAGLWFEIGGGVYGPRTLRIERPRRDGRLWPWIYRDNMPAQGFWLYFRKPDRTTPADRNSDMLSLRVR